MGVPSILWSIVRRFGRRAVRTDASKRGGAVKKVDVLCIDGNPDFYRAHEEVVAMLNHDNVGEKTRDEIDDEIVKVVIRRYAHMIARCQPTKVFLMIDGPPPFAKVEVQRRRRYQRTLLTAYERKLRAELGVPRPAAAAEWDTSQFTPGSTFMAKLHVALQRAVRTGELTRRLAAGGVGVEVTYSSHLVPGEGEHKWSPYLRNLEKPSRVVLSSNDGDVLVLATQFQQHDMRVMTRQSGNNVMVSVTEWQREVRKVLGLQGFSTQRLMQDYIFYMSLCGNDFVQGRRRERRRRRRRRRRKPRPVCPLVCAPAWWGDMVSPCVSVCLCVCLRVVSDSRLHLSFALLFTV
jgi:5'-3' exonuclease